MDGGWTGDAGAAKPGEVVKNGASAKGYGQHVLLNVIPGRHWILVDGVDGGSIEAAAARGPTEYEEVGR